ncbi:hypothetical protein BCON_0052g00260 [Botryotinia convoluta]|uniref:Uncharacterized protein n=1 Tax=Botryotinia convoluta TaxID=54673 RepID=A0A4Z1IGG9_9HELO|nr:hypothetical protein BCON_0052g00260 [Botryotinia convoluta]
MPAVTRSKSPSKEAPADPNQASSAANTSTNVAPVANMQSPAKKALAGANNALSDAMVPALAPLSPSKRKRSAKTISGDEDVGEQPSEPMKRTRVERSDAPRSRLTSGQSDLAATTYPQVERVILGLEDTPVFGTAGGAPKEGVDAGSSILTSSPKPFENTAAAPVLVGEENGATAKAPISAVTVTSGQADDETVVEQPSPHPAADFADPLTANEAEAHLPAAPQGCSSSDLEVSEEELGPPKIAITNKCKCDKLATKVKKIAKLKADLRESQALFQKKFEAAVEETNAIEIKEEAAREENNKIREHLKERLESTHKLRRERDRLSEQNQRLAEENQGLSGLNHQLTKENENLTEVNRRLIKRARELEDIILKYQGAVNILNEKVPCYTSDQQDLERTRELLRIETEKTAVYEGHFQNPGRFVAADEVVDSIETADPAQGGMSHENHNHEEHAQEDRSRRYRTPTPDNNGDNNDEEERNRDSVSYEPAEAVINTQDESQHDGPLDLPDYEYYENENQQDHQESPHPAAAVEETTSAPSDSLFSSSPSPSSSKKRKENPVSESSPAKKIKSTETELAGPSSTAAPDMASFFKPAHPGWGSPSVLSPQVAGTAPAPSTPSSVSERTTAAPFFPTVITRSGAAVQFGAATTFGAIGTAGSSVRFGSTNSFGVPALSARSSSVAASPKENDAAEDKPADQKK